MTPRTISSERAKGAVQHRSVAPSHRLAVLGVQAHALEPLAKVRDPLKAELLALVRAQLQRGREFRDPRLDGLDGPDLLLGTPTLRLMFLITWTLAFVPEL